MRLNVGESRPLFIRAKRGEVLEPIPPGGTVKLTSSNESIATVTTSPAVVTGVSGGKAVIGVEWTPEGASVPFTDTLEIEVESPATGVKLLSN